MLTWRSVQLSPSPTQPISTEMASVTPSGTEALIRVMVEAKTDEIARKVAEDLSELVKKL